MAATNLSVINQICIDLGGTGGHLTNLTGINEICTLLGATSGHVTNLSGLNSICTVMGYTAGHITNLLALNAICTGGGGTGGHFLEYNAWVEIQVGAVLNSFKGILSSTGNGSGIATLTMRSSESITLTVDGNANFYNDAAGTLGESKTWLLLSGADRTIYVKCTSGNSIFDFPADKLLKWVNWDTPVNAPSISGDVSSLVNITQLRTAWNTCNNTMYGSITKLIKLTDIYIFGDNSISGVITNMPDIANLTMGGTNTVGGDITGCTKLTGLDNISYFSTYTGSISALTELTYLWLKGNISNVSGSLNALVKLRTIRVDCPNSISGDLANLPVLDYAIMNSGTSVTISRLINQTLVYRIELTSTATFTSTNLNQLMADLWTNKDEAKSYAERIIQITGSAASGTLTGQGVIDRANLMNYSTPTPPGTAAFWTITLGNSIDMVMGTFGNPSVPLVLDEVDLAVGKTIAINWGDGTMNSYTGGVNLNISHTYPDTNYYAIMMHGEIEQITALFISNKPLYGDVSNWIVPAGCAFYYINHNRFSGKLPNIRSNAAKALDYRAQDNDITGSNVTVFREKATLYNFPGQGVAFPTSEVDKFFKAAADWYQLNAPTANCGFDLSGTNMGIPTGGNSNVDIVRLKGYYTAAGKTATVTVRTS